MTEVPTLIHAKPIGRRRAAGLALAALGASAWRPTLAQGTGLVMPVAMPCATHPGDIVGLVLEGSGAPAGTVVVFGQAFRQGDLPRGAGLAARLADGRAIPAQLDPTTHHQDGSVRFAVVSLAAPALPRGQRASVMLAHAPGATASPLDLVAELSSRSAVLDITPTGGGTPWRADLLALLRDGTRGRAARPWQSGPLAVQRRVAVPVPPAAVGGARSARLVADIALHADGTLWVDLSLRNDIAMQEGGGPIEYSLRLALDGREALSAGPLRQIQYTSFGRLLGVAKGGTAAPAAAFVRPDMGYLSETGAVARYDQSTGVEESVLARMAAAVAEPAWHEPFSPRGITQRMGTAGNRADLGPTTLWQATWLATGDPRAAAFIIGQAEADGAIPWHFWDPTGGADGSGGFMDTKRWPGFWTDPRGGRPPKTLTQPMSKETGWEPNRSHQPDLSYVPYLFTGRRAFLDGVISQGLWGLLAQWPTPRGEARSWPAVRDVNLVNESQVRSASWCLRSLDNAAWVAPDDNANTPFLRDATAANWAWLRAQIPAWTAMQGEVHGWVPGDFSQRRNGDLSPWQQDFFATTTAAAVRRGNADARAFLDWMSNFLVGRFLAGDKGFSPRDGISFFIAINVDGQSTLPILTTWESLGATTRAKGWSNADGWRRSDGYYGRLAIQSLAAIIDLTDSAQAKRALEWLNNAGAPHTTPVTHQRDPTLSIMPRGLFRVPARAPRCTAVAAPR